MQKRTLLGVQTFMIVSNSELQPMPEGQTFTHCFETVFFFGGMRDGVGQTSRSSLANR